MTVKELIDILNKMNPNMDISSIINIDMLNDCKDDKLFPSRYFHGLDPPSIEKYHINHIDNTTIEITPYYEGWK